MPNFNKKYINVYSVCVHCYERGKAYTVKTKHYCLKHVWNIRDKLTNVHPSTCTNNLKSGLICMLFLNLFNVLIYFLKVVFIFIVEGYIFLKTVYWNCFIFIIKVTIREHEFVLRSLLNYFGDGDILCSKSNILQHFSDKCLDTLLWYISDRKMYASYKLEVHMALWYELLPLWLL